MSEKVAIVGSRQGADFEHVESFVRALHAQQPDTILVSGGAAGVDTTAEQEWLRLGGVVWSFRPVRLEDYNFDPQYGVEKWELGTPQPKKYLLAEEPTWGDFSSAANFRDMLIAAACDRLVAFYRAGKSRGTAGTVLFAQNEGKPVYEYEVERWAA